VRTTIDLDPDLDAKLRSLARERGVTFKDALNSVLRRGLAGESETRPFRQRTYAMGVRPGIDLTKALQLAAELEDEEIVRKLQLRK
jgi:hypothetical protein